MKSTVQDIARRTGWQKTLQLAGLERNNSLS